MDLRPSLKDAQVYLLDVFEKNNKKIAVWMLYAYLTARATSLLATIQKRDFTVARIQLVQIFGWLVAIANHSCVYVCLEKNLRRYFPGICPSCGEAICDCPEGRLPERISQTKLDEMEARLPAVNTQLMLFNIFPGNDLDISVAHLLAEIAELGQEIVKSSLENESRPVYVSRQGFLLELADVTAHLCAVSSLLEQNLAADVLDYFADGCVVCGYAQCECLMHMIELKKVGSKRL